ncbi:MAG: hypothetical protein ACOX5R_07100 [bacterium]
MCGFIIYVNIVDFEFDISRFDIFISSENLVEDNNYQSRLEMFSSAYVVIMDNFFFGGGLGYWDEFSNPHNLFLDILSQLGLIGFTLFVLGLIYSLYYSEHMISVLIMFYLLSSMFSGALTSNRELFSLIVMSLLCRNINLYKK